MNIRLVLDELFHADRWTDVAKLIAAFRDFSCASENSREALIFNYIDFSQHNNKLTIIIFIVYSDMFRLT